VLRLFESNKKISSYSTKAAVWKFQGVENENFILVALGYHKLPFNAKSSCEFPETLECLFGEEKCMMKCWPTLVFINVNVVNYLATNAT
jgi:hypothetical protein